MKKGFVMILSALVLVSCGRPQRTVMPKSSDTKQTSTSEKKQSGMDLEAIKDKDYSSIKGTWIDGRGNELVFDDKGLVSEDVELNASSFKQKDQIAEMTVSAKSGVGGYGLLLLPKGQKAGKDDASDKSKDRIWAGQSPAYGDDDNFYYRKKEQPKDREQADTDDSSSTSKTSKAKKWNETSYYEDYINNPGTYWVSDHLYKHRDQRFYASIAYDSTYIYENLVVTRITGNMHRKSLNKASKLSTRTGYFVRKTLYEKEPIFAQNYTDYHHVILRLGRSYLNYAEACLRLNEKDKAIEYINKTRTLHGGLPAHTAAAMTLDDAWKAYKSERRVELFFEGDRYWSLIRWGKADGLEVIPELNHAFQTLEIAADGHSYEMIDVPDVHGLNSRAFSAKRYLFPIPKKEMELNKNLANDQNPGWN